MDRKEMMNALETIRKACTGRCEECKFGTTEGACKEHVVEAEIVVHGSREKPYYEIKYRKAGEANYSIGYSSYNLDIAFEFLDKYFVFDNKR